MIYPPATEEGDGGKQVCKSVVLLFFLPRIDQQGFDMMPLLY
jgi:hypothetical protein